MNPISLLLSPAGRIPASQFWLGVALMVIVAFALAAGANAGVGVLGFVGFVLLWPYFAVFGKRFRDKGNSAWLTLVPMFVAGLGWVITSIVFFSLASLDLVADYGALQGVPAEAVQDELVNNPEFAEGFEAYSQTPEAAEALFANLGERSGAMLLAATAVFWAISALIGLWPGTGGSKPEDADAPAA